MKYIMSHRKWIGNIGILCWTPGDGEDCILLLDNPHDERRGRTLSSRWAASDSSTFDFEFAQAYALLYEVDNSFLQ